MGHQPKEIVRVWCVCSAKSKCSRFTNPQKFVFFEEYFSEQARRNLFTTGLTHGAAFSSQTIRAMLQ